MDRDRTEDRIAAHRAFFANYVTTQVGLPPGSKLAAAFASTPREQFVAPPPWRVFTHTGYMEAPSDDPAFLYQDVVVSLATDSPLNNGQPTLHALCLAALAPNKGERVVHVGAGTGYYTTILAKLVGETGSVDAYEIDPELAQRATENLAQFPQVTVHLRSGAEAPLPQCDVLYVNAGATAPLAVWLDALAPNGRFVFPLTPGESAGGMLLVTKKEDEKYEASFLCQAQFVPCIGARSEAEARNLSKAFRKGNWSQVKSLHRNSEPDKSCWCSGDGWWLSTESL